MAADPQIICCLSLDNSPIAREILPLSRVVQMSEEAAGLDILLAKSQKIHVITAEFQRPPTSREISGVNCGELCLYLP